MPFTVPHVVELLQLIGVGGCGCPISSSISLAILPFLTLRNKAPNSASATDAATNLSMLHKLCIAPFSLMGSLGLGSHPRKKWPDALLLTFRFDK